MAKNQTQTELLEKDCFGVRIIRSQCSLEPGFIHKKQLKMVDGDIKVVETEVIDTQALIESEAHNAGLQNILRQEALRYGTIENALARNADKQTFADVSNVPDGVGAQAEFMQQQQQRLEALAAKLGVSVNDLLNMTEASFNNLINGKQQEAGAGTAEGGENNG